MALTLKMISEGLGRHQSELALEQVIEVARYAYGKHNLLRYCDFSSQILSGLFLYTIVPYTLESLSNQRLGHERSHHCASLR